MLINNGRHSDFNSVLKQMPSIFCSPLILMLPDLSQTCLILNSPVHFLLIKFLNSPTENDIL
jgi:hypothetical protein